MAEATTATAPAASAPAAAAAGEDYVRLQGLEEGLSDALSRRTRPCPCTLDAHTDGPITCRPACVRRLLQEKPADGLVRFATLLLEASAKRKGCASAGGERLPSMMRISLGDKSPGLTASPGPGASSERSP